MSHDIKPYTIEDLEKLIDRISKIKSTEHKEYIRDIIKHHNPEINITENKNGLWIRFDNLTKQTYTDISNYLKKISKPSLHKDSNSEINSSDTIQTAYDDCPYNHNTKLKYSNKEKTLIKRNTYEKELLTENTSQPLKQPATQTNDTLSVFIKKQTTV